MVSSKKVVLLGHFGVGKSSIIRKFVNNEFSSDYKVSIGVHILKKEVQLSNNDSVSIIIWDMEGTDSLTLINKVYLLGTHSFIYVYDVTRPLTFKSLSQDIISLKTRFPTSLIKTVGNKVDLLTDIEKEKHQVLFKINDYLSSAKTGENIEQLFQDIAIELKH